MTARKDTKAQERSGTERRDASDRRTAKRRQKEEAGFPERRTKGERREKPPEGQRRKVERRINEYRLSAEVLEFINAVNDFKSVHQKPFPTWSEIFEIFTALGYKKAD